VATKTELSSADLEEIRQNALGAPDPLGVAADLADAADNGRLADPADAGYALALAAEIAESRSKLDAALRYAERSVSAFGERTDSRAAAAKALYARVLFRVGRDDEAMAELEKLRPTLTEHSDAAAYLTAALAAGGQATVAEEWLTDAVGTALAERSAEPSSADDAGLLFFLLQQRHRLRHALGRPHDAHDNLAERLETRLANAEVTTQNDDLVFFPQAEFAQLIEQYPALVEVYGKDWDDHRARVEKDLVRLRGRAVLKGSVAGLTAQGDPTDAKTRTAYADQPGEEIPWPPERNDHCWCGSGLKYKKCCLPRSRG
jgi:tetratricopeptide (TPR) repeat protein